MQYYKSGEGFDAFYEGLIAGVEADPEISEDTRNCWRSYLVMLNLQEGLRLGIYRLAGQWNVEATEDGATVEAIDLKEGGLA